MPKKTVDRIARLKSELALAEITESPEFNQKVVKMIADEVEAKGGRVDSREEVVLNLKAYLRNIELLQDKADEAKDNVSELASGKKAA